MPLTRKREAEWTAALQHFGALDEGPALVPPTQSSIAKTFRDAYEQRKEATSINHWRERPQCPMACSAEDPGSLLHPETLTAQGAVGSWAFIPEEPVRDLTGSWGPEETASQHSCRPPAAFTAEGPTRSLSSQTQLPQSLPAPHGHRSHPRQYCCGKPSPIQTVQSWTQLLQLVHAQPQPRTTHLLWSPKQVLPLVTDEKIEP
uniref:Uncharacterized protein n=1 Tax=Pipistrellus kuhlii TaxID=59472 RepID=A0A7J7XVE9_PIPKU|nr:hypothetical protein mPipKuh1_010477 [Pipistrellus kuhlii]